MRLKIFTIKRKTRIENRYSPRMGRLVSDVTKIKLYLFGIIPIKEFHSYRSTYYGEVKDLEDCDLNI